MDILNLDAPYPHVPKELEAFADARGVHVGPFFGLPGGRYQAQRHPFAPRYLTRVGFMHTDLRAIAAYLCVLPLLDSFEPADPVRIGEPLYAEPFEAVCQRANALGFTVNLARYAEDAQMVSVVRRSRLVDTADFYWSPYTSKVMAFLDEQVELQAH